MIARCLARALLTCYVPTLCVSMRRRRRRDEFIVLQSVPVVIERTLHSRVHGSARGRRVLARLLLAPLVRVQRRLEPERAVVLRGQAVDLAGAVVHHAARPPLALTQTTRLIREEEPVPRDDRPRHPRGGPPQHERAPRLADVVVDPYVVIPRFEMGARVQRPRDDDAVSLRVVIVVHG
eukprot:31314-Pelagococcus_subviridis.AAC.37